MQKPFNFFDTLMLCSVCSKHSNTGYIIYPISLTLVFIEKRCNRPVKWRQHQVFFTTLVISLSHLVIATGYVTKFLHQIHSIIVLLQEYSFLGVSIKLMCSLEKTWLPHHHTPSVNWNITTCKCFFRQDFKDTNLPVNTVQYS